MRKNSKLWGKCNGKRKVKVLGKAKEEINRVTTYCVDYSYIKRARSVIAIRFHINMCYHMF